MDGTAALEQLRTMNAPAEAYAAIMMPVSIRVYLLIGGKAS